MIATAPKTKPAFTRVGGELCGISDTGWLPTGGSPWVVTGIGKDQLIIQDGAEVRAIPSSEFRLQGKSASEPAMGLHEMIVRPYARYLAHGGDVRWLHLWPIHLDQVDQYAKEHPDLKPHKQRYPVGSVIKFDLPKHWQGYDRGSVIAWNPRNACYWVHSEGCPWLLCVVDELIKE